MRITYQNHLEEIKARHRNALSAATAEWDRGAPRTWNPPSEAILAHCKVCGRQSHDWNKSYCTECHPEVSKVWADLYQLDQFRIQRETRSRTQRHYRSLVRSIFSAEIPPRYRDCWFRNFRTETPETKHVAEQVTKWCTTKDAHAKYPFLYLYGRPGLGKTHLAIAAAKAFGRRIAVPYFWSEVKFLSAWQRGFDAHSQVKRDREGLVVKPTAARPTDLVDEACHANVLVWDDLGKAKPTDAWARAIFQIIDHRWENNLPTLITSNYNVGDLPERIGESTADRATSGIVLTLTGASMRGVA